MNHRGGLVQTKNAAGSIKAAAEYIALGAFLFFLVVIQTTWVHAAAVFHVIPDLVLVFCVCLCLKQGGLFAVSVSVLCGFLLDLSSGRQTGYDALLYLYISAGCVWLRGRIFCRSRKMAMLCVFFASVLYAILVFGIHGTFWNRTSFGNAFLHAILPEASYNALVTLILYPAACRFAKGRSVYREETP